MNWVALALFAAESATPDPSHIVEGNEAAECQWPSVAQVETVIDGMTFGCTGVLVAPDVVLTAGHCIFADALPFVRFGENADTPADVLLPVSCERHPQYFEDPDAGTDFDLAVCRLQGDAPGVPLVPLLAGCEADVLAVDGMVTVVGFGTNDEATLSGAGIKRIGAMRIESVSDEEIVLRGVDGSGTCYGDSGGPVFAAMADGTWRVAGIASTAHPVVYDCGYGAVYDRFDLELAWVEEVAGSDLTPCHDADGTWNPTASCDGFPLAPDAGGATWAESCQGGASSDRGASCGPAFGDDEGTTTGSEESGSSSSDDDGGSSDESSSSSGVVEGTEGEVGSGGSSVSEPVDEFEPPQSEADDGCGCRSSSSGTGAIALLVIVSACARRRRSG